MNTDILPFKKAVQKGVGSIMVGHLSIPALDDRPASLSRKIMTDLLRGELGFDGLIMTDALNMDALKDTGNVPVECLRAGADVLLHPHDPDVTVRELISAIESGEVTEGQVDAAVNRILRMKARLKKADESAIDYQGHGKLSSQITEMSISLFKNTPGLLPIRDKSKIHIIFAGDGEMFQSSPFKKHFEKCLPLHDIAEKLPPLLPPSDSAATEVTIFAIFTSVSAWKGSSGISENDRNRIHDLMRTAGHSIAISFGSPYVLRHFKDADTLIAAYEATEQAQSAVIECIEGRLGFKGRIPVKID
jgi:beta-glucosidase-like glycosyl hydrolase